MDGYIYVNIGTLMVLIAGCLLGVVGGFFALARGLGFFQ